MKLADVKWERLLDLLPQWDELPPNQRLLWLDMQPEERYELHRAGVRVLIDGGWIAPAGGKYYAVPSRRRYFHRVLRALSRAPVLEDYGRGDPQRLIDYLTAHFSPRDCAALSRSGAGTNTGRVELAAEMGRGEWVADFLREEPGAEAKGSAQRRWRLALPTTVASARQLIATVLYHGTPIPIAALLAALRGTTDEEVLAPGLAFACREALALIGLDREGRLFAGVWRSPSAGQLAAVPESAPEFDSDEALFCRPLLIDDMAMLLVEATAAPPRLKAADHFELFARSRNTIARALTALPAWLDTSGTTLPHGVRVDLAAASVHQLGLAAVAGDRGKDLRLVVTERGRRWLGLAVGARLKLVLDALRDAADGESPWPDDDDQDDEFPLSDDEDADESAGDGPLILDAHLNYLPYDPGPEARWYPPIECRAAVAAAFRSIAGAAAVTLTDFIIEWRSKNNPLTEGGGVGVFLPLEVVNILEEEWEATLVTFFFQRLVALGGVTLGRLVSGRVGFRLTPVGRYLLLDTDRFEFEEAEDTGEVLVQPNFEIVFLAPSADAQLRARAYAEPTAALEGPDSVGTLFVLRRESVQRAVRAGRDADGIVASLRRLSKHPLPENVERQVAAWAAEVRWIAVRPAVVVDCGEAETAARVLAAVGKNGRQLSATAVELFAGSDLTAAIRKKLGAAGIFVRS